jgi:hypothetical protein
MESEVSLPHSQESVAAIGIGPIPHKTISLQIYFIIVLPTSPRSESISSFQVSQFKSYIIIFLVSVSMRVTLVSTLWNDQRKENMIIGRVIFSSAVPGTDITVYNPPTLPLV